MTGLVQGQVPWMLAGIALLASVGADALADEKHAAVTRYIRFSLTLENPRNTPLAEKNVWIYGPAAATATQKLRSLEINVPHVVQHDATGNTIIRLHHLNLAPYESRVITLGAQLDLRSEPIPDHAPIARALLEPQAFVESDDPAIRAAAVALRGPDAAASGRSIYLWVRSHLEYSGYLPDELGARFAIENRKGDCTEFADLSAALSRALAIPARVVGGYFVDGDTVIRARDYHNWSEVHVGDHWMLLDAQKGNFGERVDQYIAFHVADAGAPNEMQGAERFRADDGLVVRWE